MSRPTDHHRGFTLIELTITLVIMGLLATMIVPRLSGTARRSYDLGVDQVADLLTMYAHREQIEPRPVGLRYDSRRQTLLVVILDETTNEWETDLLTRPVKLPAEIDGNAVTVYVEGGPVHIDEYPFSAEPGQLRPLLEIEVRPLEPDLADPVTLRLEPHAIAPRRSDRNAYFDVRQPIDLDASGRRREDW